MTPYDKLKSLPNAEQYLKPNISFHWLDTLANRDSDLDAWRQLRKDSQSLVQKNLWAEQQDRMKPQTMRSPFRLIYGLENTIKSVETSAPGRRDSIRFEPGVRFRRARKRWDRPHQSRIDH